MKFEEITALLDRGLTPDQIMALMAQPGQQEQQEQQDQQNEQDQQDQQNEQDRQQDQQPTNSDILSAIGKLITTVQASAIYNAQQPDTPHQPDAFDVMKQISIPAGMGKKGGK